MAKPKQISLFSAHSRTQAHEPRREHGGELRQGRRKLARPYDTKRPLHLVLKSSRAKGDWSLLRAVHEKPVRELAHRLGRQFGVRIHQYANSGNHLHLLVQARTKEGFRAFLRSLSGLIARRVTGARRGQAMGKFWDHLAFTEVVEWGRHFFGTRYYVIRNELEANGLVPFQPRKKRKRRLA